MSNDSDENIASNGRTIQDKIHGNPQTIFPPKSSETTTGLRDNNVIKESPGRRRKKSSPRPINSGKQPFRTIPESVSPRNHHRFSRPLTMMVIRIFPCQSNQRNKRRRRHHRLQRKEPLQQLISLREFPPRPKSLV